MEIVQLTESEWIDRQRLEQVVEENMAAWVQVGMALKEIRDRQLYRTTHTSFEEYVKERFDYARSTAYQFISGVQVIENVRNAGSHYGMLPEKEALVRPLTRLESDEQPRAWRLAIDRANETNADGVKAQHVVWAVSHLRGAPQPRLKTKINEAVGVLPGEFQKAFRSLTQSVYAAKKKRFEGVDRKKMIQIIDRLKRLLEG